MENEHEAIDSLSISINERLSSISTVSSSGCSIFKVPNLLRQTNEKAYEPQIISIGPYYHGKDHLKGMEARKMHYLKRFLQRRGEISVNRYVMALKVVEENIRKCYAEPLDDVNGDALVNMMLLDGCFIIELICEYSIPEIREDWKEEDDFQNISLATITRDLLLMENQLPFFVLLTLVSNPETFIHMALFFFSRMMPGPGISSCLVISYPNIKNLLGLVHDSWLPSLKVRDNYSKSSAVYGEWNLTRTATELQEAGIKFKTMDKNEEKSLFDIKFKNGVLWIPTIKMEQNTDSILRNLIAYEQCYDNYRRYVTDYVTFMDCLISTTKDVALLCRSGTIFNRLGDDEVMAAIFKRLCDTIELSDLNFYSEIYINVKKHCDKKWNKWMANLKHKYIKNPWALTWFLAVLTVVQGIYALLSYYYQY